MRPHRAHVCAVTALTMMAVTAVFALSAGAVDSSAAIDVARRLCVAEPTLFQAMSTDAAMAADLMQGRLTLAPHPTVTLPDDPTWSERLVDQDNWEVRYQAMTWVDPLRREFLRTGDRAMFDRYAFFLRDFATDNRSFDSPTSPWTWVDHPSGHRSSVLACSVSVLGAPTWLVDAMRLHGDTVSRLDQYKGWGNHSLMQNSGLLAIGCVMDEAAYRDLALTRSETLLTGAIDSQGVLNEGSYAYQWSNYKWWSELRNKTTACGEETTSTWNRIDLMPVFTTHATQPTGRAVPFGDTHVGYSGSPTGLTQLASTNAFYGRGYLFSRSGWATARPAAEESMVSLRYGQSYAEQPHGHMDAGNIDFAAFGTPFVTDSGMYAYGGGFWRSWVKQPVAHNVVTADGAAYRRDRRTPLLHRQTTATHTLATVGSTVIDGANWYRTVLYSKRGHWILVQDRVTSNYTRMLHQRWNLPDGATFTVEGKRIDQQGTGPGLTIKWLVGPSQVRIAEGERGTTYEATAGWRSSRYGTIAPAPAAIGSYASKERRFVTLVAARNAGEAPDRVDAYGITMTSTGIRVTVVTPRGHEHVSLEPNGFTVD